MAIATFFRPQAGIAWIRSEGADMLKRWLASFLGAALLAATPAPATDSGASALDALAAQYWRRELQNNYYLRLEIGKPIETIRPISYDNASDDAAFAQQMLGGLDAIDASKLDHDRWLTYRTLRYLAGNDVAEKQFYWLTQQATPYAGGSQIAEISNVLASFAFANAADATRYESLLHQYAAFVKSLGDLLKGQHERGIILPNVESEASAAVFDGYAKQSRGDSLVPALSRLAALSSGDSEALRASARNIENTEIVPAFDAVAAYLKGPYRVGAPAGVGLRQYPGGLEYYRYLAFASTTIHVEPEALHETGMQQVAAINAKLDGIRKQVGFHGNLAAFKHYLATDPRFFLKTTQQFGDRLEIYVRRSAAAVPQYFLHTPKAPYGVEPLPKELAGSQTFGYYDPPTASKAYGHYLYNAWHPERTSDLGAGALICHELIPGHHFQIALQQENTALPDVRHYDFSEVGFVEGWGEYASQLCWDMGVYTTPYDKAGRLMQDLMVSTRLVVDTGMNAMGWSLERARQFMRDNLTISEAQIESESLRYSTDIPGQALGYKTGELTMLELREHARKELGSKFDIRQFHAWVLDSGAMTLDTLREHINYEIAHVSPSLSKGG
ncbi:MAG TPA: DUF885 domain-containing protein [Candidatus Baltobacteraceae bacterium]|nr:DUF885 domain-containing protein [Candidatus Baltobacteraceae bacterium]